MCELQSTIEFSVELYKFYNVDLFQRGMYQVRCSLRVSSKLGVEVEVTTPEVTAGLGTAIVLGNYGACHPFQILYRNEEVSLKDVVLFRCHMLVDGNNLKESLEKAEFSLILELWFSDSSPVSMVMVSSRTLQLNVSPVEGLHYHLPVLFDYFHLSAISLTIHAVLTALHQPSMKKGIFRYMQSCAPKSSKSWSKTRSTQCSSLTDPVLPVSSHKIYSKLNGSPQIHLEARDVLLDASNSLKTVIKEYHILIKQREDTVFDNYDTLMLKAHHRYDTKKLMKKSTSATSKNACLAELCADNIRLWNYFLLSFSCKTIIQQYLSRKHHTLRVRRFAELFFIVYNPRKSALGCCDVNFQKYLLIAELAKRSKYMQNLPMLPVHCAALDGDNTTMPIIFEDQYQNSYDFDGKQNETANTMPEYAVVNKKPKSGSSHCSCDASSFQSSRKYLEKGLHRLDFDTRPVINNPKYSKSLDQLQMCSKNSLHYSLGNICVENGHYTNKSDRKRTSRPLKNVSSEHDMRQTENYFPTKIISNIEDEDPIDVEDIEGVIENRIFKQFTIKNLSRGKYQQIVKSLSVTPDTTPNMFRSSSVQFFSPKKNKGTTGENSGNKFKSLATKRNQNHANNKSRIETYVVEVVENNQKTKSKKSGNNKRFQIGSTSSSTDSLMSMSIIEQTKTGSKCEGVFSVVGIRKVRSASCLHRVPLCLMSGTESLPNITSKLEQALYTKTKYYSSSSSTSSASASSTTSEQSGWITSRSSSSTDVTISNVKSKTARKKQNKLGDFSKDLRSSRRGRSKGGDVVKMTNGHRETDIKAFGCQVDLFSNGKGCDLTPNHFCDIIPAVPPPKQFRDLESPSSSSAITSNGTVNEEEQINAVDNILYHVVDNHTTLERPLGEEDTAHKTNDPFYEDAQSEVEKSYLRAKKQFLSQLNISGTVYSELDSFASTIPYFHVSDEFRIFSPEGMHLIVCVHGLDGNSADLRLVKTYLELGLPGAYLDFLMSERNQGDTFSDFDTMTDRLVSEILHYLDSSSIRPTRVSFVGHSLGNIIIRSALTRPQMKFLLPRLHTFLSLSGPHLGTLYNSSGLVNMGMWFMQKWKKSGSLLQLCLKDSNEIRQTFLYRLSQKSTLHYFKNILLCGSGQDRYVPLHSARIELCKESIKDTSEQGAIYREMVQNILSPIVSQKDVNLLRYDIHHALPNTANAFIGRAAHIAVLDSEIFIEKFMAVVGLKYFR